jgi:hypothetical protein
VEIVIRATPDRDALEQLIDDTNLAAYTASSEARLVTDPATLLPYAREERISWYASLDGRPDTLLQSEHSVSTTSYGADQPRVDTGVPAPAP